jgi:hypothetical protein
VNAFRHVKNQTTHRQSLILCVKMCHMPCVFVSKNIITEPHAQDISADILRVWLSGYILQQFEKSKKCSKRGENMQSSGYDRENNAKMLTVLLTKRVSSRKQLKTKTYFILDMPMMTMTPRYLNSDVCFVSMCVCQGCDYCKGIRLLYERMCVYACLHACLFVLCMYACLYVRMQMTCNLA